MIILRTFDNAIEAYLLKSRLENEGIPAYVLDENIVTMNPLYNNLIGGVKVTISELDADRARKLVDGFDWAERRYNQGCSCPRCGSANFYSGFKTIKNIKGVFAFLLSIFSVFTRYPISR